MNIKNLLLGGLLAVTATLTGCNNDKEYNPTYVDFVTLESFSDAGATMTLRKSGDSPLITYTTTQKFPAPQFQAGQRIVISYETSTGMQYVSGPINVFEAMVTEGKGAQASMGTAAETEDWASDPVTIKAINISGDYLDFTMTANTSRDGKTFDLVLDEATADDEMPQYHLIFKANTGNVIKNYYFYCSYNVSDSWANPQVKGIRVYYRDTVNGNQYIDLTKDKINQQQ